MSQWTPKRNTNNRRGQFNRLQKSPGAGRSYQRYNTDSSVNNTSHVYQSLSNVQHAYNSPTPYGAPTYAQSCFSTPNNNNNNNNPSPSIADQFTAIKNEIQSLEESDCRRVYRICANLIDGKTSKESKDPRVLNMENPFIGRLSEVLCHIGFRQITVQGKSKLNYGHSNMNVPHYVIETVENIQKTLMSQKNNKKMSQSSGSSSSSFDLASSQYGSCGHGAMANRRKKGNVNNPNNKNHNNANANKGDDSHTDYSGYSSKEGKQSRLTAISEAVRKGKSIEIEIFDRKFAVVHDDNKENTVEAYYTVLSVGAGKLLTVHHKCGQNFRKPLAEWVDYITKIL